MATLPQPADYGSRVALRSNRIDLPGSGEAEVADALANAATTFATMAIQHKEKDDALSYSNAKNEYLIADIQEREKLKDDQDFDTHDERYRVAMQGHYERLFPTVRSSRDRNLFDVEARLMNERGSVAVGENSRVKRIDWNVATFRRHGVELQGVIMAAEDAQTARDAMFAYLDHANSLLTAGFLEPTEHQAETQKFVTDTSRKRVEAMDPKVAEAVLEQSVALTRAQGERITREQIAAGEGSDSIADFIPLNERVQMLEKIRKVNDIDQYLEEGFAAKDQAWYLFPGIDQMKERAAYYRESGLSAEARLSAEAADARELKMQGEIRQEDWRATDRELRDLIRDNDESFYTLDGTAVASLPDSMQRSLSAFSKRWHEGQGFSDHTTFEALEAFENLTPEERQNWSADDYMPTENATDPVKTWSDNIDRGTAELWLKSSRQDRESIASATPPVPEAGLPTLTLFGQMLVETPYFDRKPTGTDSDALKQQWATLMIRYDAEVVRLGGEGKLSPTERREVMAEVLRFEAFVDVPWKKDKQLLVEAMTPDQKLNAYIPLDTVDANGKTAFNTFMSYDDPQYGSFSGLTIDFLKNNFKALQPAGTEMDEDLLEQAYFYLITKGPKAALDQLADRENL
jgi:hypothetical protein